MYIADETLRSKFGVMLQNEYRDLLVCIFPLLRLDGLEDVSCLK